MAKMDFREPNRVKWIGVRPAHEGIQALQSNLANNSTAIVYTVGAGKVLHWCGYIFSSYASVVDAAVNWHVRDALDAITCYIGSITHRTVGQIISSQAFWPPVEIPTGYDICIVNNLVTCYSRLTIWGWAE